MQETASQSNSFYTVLASLNLQKGDSETSRVGLKNFFLEIGVSQYRSSCSFKSGFLAAFESGRNSSVFGQLGGRYQDECQ